MLQIGRTTITQENRGNGKEEKDFGRHRCNRGGALFIALYLHSRRVTRDFSSSSFPFFLFSLAHDAAR